MLVSFRVRVYMGECLPFWEIGGLDYLAIFYGNTMNLHREFLKAQILLLSFQVSYHFIKVKRNIMSLIVLPPFYAELEIHSIVRK